MPNADGRFGRRASDRDPGWRQIVAAFRVVLVVVGVAAALWLVFQVRTVILLLVLSIFFAYLVAPLVDLVSRPFLLRQRQRRLSTGVAVGVVYLLLAGLLTVVLAWLAPHMSQQASQMTSQAPQYLHVIQERSRAVSAGLDRLGLSADTKKAIESTLGDVGRSVEGAGREVLVSIVGVFTYVPWLVLIPIIAFFLLKDAQAFHETAVYLLPEGRARVNGMQLFDRINTALAAYIRAQLLACLIIGVTVTAGFALLGVPYALVLGALAGLAEFVPLVGPLALAVVSIALAALHDPVLALWVAVFLVVLRIVEDYVIYPRLVGSVIDMHPLAVVLAVLAGAELGGVAGVFLSVPVVAILSAGYRQYLSYTLVRSSQSPPAPPASGASPRP